MGGARQTDDVSPRRPGPAAIGIALVLLGIVSVQFGSAIAKASYGQIDAIGIVTMRLVFSAIIMLAITRPRLWGWTGEQWRPVILLGVLLALMNGMFYMSITTIPIGVAVTLEMIGPLTVAIAQTRRWSDALWVGLAAIGVVLLGARSFAGELDPLGIVLALGAGAAWGGYILASRQVGAKVKGLGGLAGAMGVSAIIAIPIGTASTIPAVIANPFVLLIGLAIAVCASAVPYGLELSALRRIGTREFGILMALEPAAASLMGFLIVHEHLTFTELLAIVLVAVASAGVAMTAARPKRRSARDAPDELPPPLG